MKSVTKSGFEFEIDDECLDDYELLEDLCEIDNGNNAKIVEVVSKILGKEQKDRLKDHLRDENGRVTATKMGEAIDEILRATKEGKNS